MKCPNCNREVSEEWSICPFCKYEPVKCPNCDSGWLPQDAKFCPSCGCSLDESSFDVDEDDSLRCPYCGSDDFTDDGTNYLQYQCNKCSRRWGGTDDESDEDEVVVCPECYSDDIADDGSGYLQYECNDCGHINWGNRDDIECPECGSDNIWDDGSDYMQYKCLDCDHVWGDDDDEEDVDETKDNITDELHKFFPVAGIILGETTIEDASKAKSLYDEFDYYNSNHAHSGCYDKNGTTIIMYKGIQFRKENEDDCLSNIYMTCYDEMFTLWKCFGFDWDLSYINWKNLFIRRGYKVEVESAPRTKFWKEQGYTYLSAKFVAIAPDSTILFVLDFDYGRDGYLESSRKTLYSLTVIARKSSRWNDYAI